VNVCVSYPVGLLLAIIFPTSGTRTLYVHTRLASLSLSLKEDETGYCVVNGCRNEGHSLLSGILYFIHNIYIVIWPYRLYYI
jgi:hypothetical protein